MRRHAISFGAQGSNEKYDPLGPPTEARKEDVRKFYELLLPRVSVASDGGMRRMSPDSAASDLISATSKTFCDVIADGDSVLLIPAKNPKTGDVVVGAEGPSMIGVLGYWLDQSGKPAGYNPAWKAFERVTSRGKNYVYGQVRGTGNQSVLVLSISSKAKDAASCETQAKASGGTSCEWFELMRPGESLAKSQLDRLPPKEKSSRTIWYIAAGFAVVATGVFLLGSKKSEATPNLRRRRR